ncbi:hypothetical protein STRDD11_02347 [Streptococcus sp. DD11]|uniref:YdeI/OmpD-associated family protein n=1 Tax=Streptococcus sp. DD11 TaxID=1777879 RepID=UPI000792D56E|nr:hypothetical protein [Streptococcus sp. DD11]KXT78936.1 hypothetical protein STRDD11_02347 [Streptococcus sp. DD11]
MIKLDQLRENLAINSFETRDELHDWLLENGQSSADIWVRIFKTKSKAKSVSFHEVLEEGLCFGWSESMRRSYDDLSYLQKFTPRKGSKTQSERNLKLVGKLESQKRMRPEGYTALGLDSENL